MHLALPAPHPRPHLQAAWGALQKKESQLMVRSYELGVLLVPRLEEAYRTSRWVGFSCTSSQPQPAPGAAWGRAGKSGAGKGGCGAASC